jgi:hypothetical protein
MSYPKINGLLTDPPGPGDCKLRIKSDGTLEGTRVVVVDSDGRELELLGVMSVNWKLDWTKPELAAAELRVEGSVETELDALEVDVRAENARAVAEGPKS